MQCVACEGTGKASKGGPCVPCHGTGGDGGEVPVVLIESDELGLARLPGGRCALYTDAGAVELTLAQWERVLGAALADKQWRKAADRGTTEAYKRVALGNAREALQACLQELNNGEAFDHSMSVNKGRG